jgi:hypothetical protein
MATLTPHRLIPQSLRVASGKTRSNTLIGSALRSEVPADVRPGLLAQLVEQVTLNHRVGGSSPSQPTSVTLCDFSRHAVHVVQSLELRIPPPLYINVPLTIKLEK